MLRMSCSDHFLSEGMLLGLGDLEKDKNYGFLPLGLVAMATENSHRLKMGIWLSCIFLITSKVM